MRICLLFHNLFDKNDIKLEQKIVNDGNSCGKCWRE